MAFSSGALEGVWLGDTHDLLDPTTIAVSAPSTATPTSSEPMQTGEDRRSGLASHSHHVSGAASLPPSGDPTPYGVTAQQLDALSAMAYLVGSPLQRQQPSGSDTTHPALLLAAKLLQQGVDPERVIELVNCRHSDTPC